MKRTIRVLFVDDDADFGDQAEKYLTRNNHGIDVEMASSVEKALEMIETNDFEAVVSDYKMSPMDGIDFLKEIRDSGIDIPFIIFTGKGREEVAVKALNLGADRYIQKGGDPESQYGVLADAIEQEVELYRKRKELERSEKEKSLVLKNTDEIIAYHDLDHNIVWANEAYQEATGMSQEELEGKKCYETWGLEMECENCPVTKAIETGKSAQTELSPESQEQWSSEEPYWLVKSSPVEDSKGDIIGAVEVASDITEEKRNRQESKRKEKYLDHTPEFLNVIDEEGKIRYQSYPSSRHPVLDPKKIVGSDAIEFVHPDDREKTKELFSKVLENPGEEYRMELRGETQKGWTWFEVRAINHLDDPEINGMIVSSRDITEMKEKERELEKNKKRFKTLVSNAQEGIYIRDLGGTLTYVNEKFAEIHGYEKDELIGMESWDLLHPDFREKIEPIRKNDQDNIFERDNPAELRIQRKDGEVRNVLVTNEKLEDVEGNTEVFGIVHDITDMKKAEEERKESERKLKELHQIASKLENAQSEDEICQIAVDAAEEILEFSVCSIDLINESGKLVVKAVSKSVSDGDYIETVPEEDFLGGKTFLNNESYLIDDLQSYEDAKPVKDEYLSALSVPIDKKGVFQAISTEKGYFDERDLEMAELLMDHVNEALKRMEMADREEFLHSLLRHDVKNKSQIVEGYLELMEDYDLPDEVEEYVNKANKAMKESDEIIEKVRKLREIEKEEIDEVNLKSVLGRVLSELQHQLKEEEIDINVEKLDCTVEGGALLDELFSNLVENSIRHADCGEINIEGKSKKEECIITVEDDGIGIPDDIKDKIFERGFKKSENAGSGVGMYLVREIAESYGGRVEVKDSELGGARFDVRLLKVKSDDN